MARELRMRPQWLTRLIWGARVAALVPTANERCVAALQPAFVIVNANSVFIVAKEARANALLARHPATRLMASSSIDNNNSSNNNSNYNYDDGNNNHCIGSV